MAFMTSNLAIETRTARPVLSSVAMRLRRSRNYEALLTDATMRVVSPGNCVWDVGANVGFYARQFAHAVGASGHVYAFVRGIDQPNKYKSPCCEEKSQILSELRCLLSAQR
jgi:predicted methyltransferase